jgi:hypothetical protein
VDDATHAVMPQDPEMIQVGDADRMTRCGHRGCRCHADPPRMHGPYHQWTRKKDGKTATRILTADYGP